MSYTDVGDIIAATPDLKTADNDAVVCTALRWAKRTTDAGVGDVADICAMLGVDLSGAIERARDAR